MSVLVTGGAGFIGSHFIELLLAQTDERIVCLDNFNNYYDPALKRQNVAGFLRDPRVKLIEADVCDAPQMRRLFDAQQVDRVVHFAAYAGVRPSIERPLVYMHANVQGTTSLLEAARYHPVDRFVLASSSTVYGQGADAPFEEDASLGIPLSPYGASKQGTEAICNTYYVLHGLPIVCCRPFSVYGPRLRPDLALTIFTRAILCGEPLPLFGDGSMRRDFTHIHDICQGFYEALTRDDAVGETFNLGNDQPVEIRHLIELIERSAGRQAKIERYAEKPGEMRITHANLRKAHKVLGYHPAVPLDEGVREYVDWFRGTLE